MVHARDTAGHPTTAEATLLVYVLDANDNPPLIAFDVDENGAGAGGAGAPLVRVAEGAESRDRQLAIVSVSDPDAGANGQFGCALEASGAALFQLVPYQQAAQASGAAYYQLKVAAEGGLDREAPAVRDGALVLTVTCEDHGVPHRLSSQRTLTVTVDSICLH